MEIFGANDTKNKQKLIFFLIDNTSLDIGILSVSQQNHGTH